MKILLNVVHILAAMACGLASPAALAEDKPALAFQSEGGLNLIPPHPNFHWVRLSDVEASVMIPDGWIQHHKVVPGGPIVHAFSKEPLGANGMFMTGFTAMSFPPPSNLPDPGAHCLSMIMLLSRAVETKVGVNLVLHKSGYSKAGHHVLILRHRNAPPGEVPVVIHSMYLGDIATGRVRQFTFEAPETSWAESWARGQEIMRLIAIDTPSTASAPK